MQRAQIPLTKWSFVVIATVVLHLLVACLAQAHEGPSAGTENAVSLQRRSYHNQAAKELVRRDDMYKTASSHTFDNPWGTSKPTLLRQSSGSSLLSTATSSPKAATHVEEEVGKRASWLARNPKGRNAIAVGLLGTAITYAWVSTRHAAHLNAIPDSVKNAFSKPPAPTTKRSYPLSYDGYNEVVQGIENNDDCPDCETSMLFIRRGNMGTTGHVLLGMAGGVAVSYWYKNSLVKHLTDAFHAPAPSTSLAPRAINGGEVEADESGQMIVGCSGADCDEGTQAFSQKNKQGLTSGISMHNAFGDIQVFQKRESPIGKTFYMVYGGLAGTLGYAVHQSSKRKSGPNSSAAPAPANESVSIQKREVLEESSHDDAETLVRRANYEAGWGSPLQLNAKTLISPDRKQLQIRWKTGGISTFMQVQGTKNFKRAEAPPSDGDHGSDTLVRRDNNGWVRPKDIRAWTKISPDRNTVNVHWASGNVSTYVKNGGNFGNANGFAGTNMNSINGFAGGNMNGMSPYGANMNGMNAYGNGFAMNMNPNMRQNDATARQIQQGMWSGPQLGFDNGMMRNGSLSSSNSKMHRVLLLSLFVALFLALPALGSLGNDGSAIFTKRAQNALATGPLATHTARQSANLNGDTLARYGITTQPHTHIPSGWPKKIPDPSKETLQKFKTPSGKQRKAKGMRKRTVGSGVRGSTVLVGQYDGKPGRLGNVPELSGLDNSSKGKRNLVQAKGTMFSEQEAPARSSEEPFALAEAFLPLVTTDDSVIVAEDAVSDLLEDLVLSTALLSAMIETGSEVTEHFTTNEIGTSAFSSRQEDCNSDPSIAMTDKLSLKYRLSHRLTEEGRNLLLGVLVILIVLSLFASHKISNHFSRLESAERMLVSDGKKPVASKKCSAYEKRALVMGPIVFLTCVFAFALLLMTATKQSTDFEIREPRGKSTSHLESQFCQEALVAPSASSRPGGMLIADVEEVSPYATKGQAADERGLVLLDKRVPSPGSKLEKAALIGTSTLFAGAGALAAHLAFSEGPREPITKRFFSSSADALDDSNSRSGDPNPSVLSTDVDADRLQQQLARRQFKTAAGIGAGVVGGGLATLLYLHRDAKNKQTGYGVGKMPELVWRRSLMTPAQ